jgi:RNA polymerase sigma factor (sigma-70 family)
VRRGREEGGVKDATTSSVVRGMAATDRARRGSQGPSGMLSEFERCFREEYEGVARTSAVAVGDGDLGREIAQEAFARLYERWDRMRSPEHARRFAYRVAFNLSRSYLRRSRRIRAGDDVDKARSGPGPDPTDLAADRLTILDVVARLSARQQACLLMIDFAGFDAKETAKTLRIRPATVHVHLSRARRAVRAALNATD